MKMFDFFSRKEAEKAAKEIMEDFKFPEPVREKTSDEQDWYRVGYTNDGRTTLTLLNGPASMTLTMNEDGVKRLIKMLESTLPQDYVKSSKGE
jgi:hypothetical protein